MERPSRTELLKLAKRLGAIQPNDDFCANAPALTQAAQIFRDLAAEQDPEEPKVETLQDARKRCVSGRKNGETNFTADMVDSMARELEPEPPKVQGPKVESLRSISRRLHRRGRTHPSDDPADLSAIVLGQVDSLAELMRLYLAGSTEMGDLVSQKLQEALRGFRAELALMREGSE